MKKVIITLVSLCIAGSMVFAQDLAEATELYNSGAAALASGNKQEALDNFVQALGMAVNLGVDGEAIVANCKDAIPKVNISIIKGIIKEGNFDEAIEKCKAAALQAVEFGQEEAAGDLKDLVATALQIKGKGLLSAKNYAGAAEAFKEILAADQTNGAAALMLGQAFAGLGQTEDAIAAYEQAAANGQQANATKQLANTFVKMAAAALKAKDNQGAFDAAVKSAGYAPTANAFKVAGTAALNLGNKEEAINYLGKYLQAAPTAADAAQIKAAIAALGK